VIDVLLAKSPVPEIGDLVEVLVVLLALFGSAIAWVVNRLRGRTTSEPAEEAFEEPLEPTPAEVTSHPGEESAPPHRKRMERPRTITLPDGTVIVIQERIPRPQKRPIAPSTPPPPPFPGARQARPVVEQVGPPSAPGQTVEESPVRPRQSEPKRRRESQLQRRRIQPTVSSKELETPSLPRIRGERRAQPVDESGERKPLFETEHAAAEVAAEAAMTSGMMKEIRSRLRSTSRLGIRQAILMSEILSPPLSLKQRRGDFADPD
jgi:hypothetical protein